MRSQPKQDKILDLLESVHQEYHHQEERKADPVHFVHRYVSPADQEIVALFASLLAYGNVQTILNSVEKILLPLGKSPSESLLKLDLKGTWTSFRHRFTTGDDIEILAHWIRSALLSHGSLENFFADGVTGNPSMREILSSFVRRFTGQKLPSHLVEKKVQRSRNLKYLISDPGRGSACKRLNMFLRWMVRPSDGVDLGIWKSLSPKTLMLPIDTHLLQTLQKLKWTKSQTANWKVVEEATERLKRICPDDPIRYDFALCHLSMNGIDIRKFRSGS